MTALLQKDCIVIWKTSKLVLAAALLLAVLSMDSETLFFSIYAPMVLTSLSVTTIAYDEQSKWDVYALTMPYDRRTVVRGKYLLSALECAVGMALPLGAFVCAGFSQGTLTAQGICLIAVAALAVGTVNTVIMLPVTFRFGSASGRVVYIVCLVVIFGAASQISLPAAPETAFWPLMGIVAAVCAALWVVSYLLSVRIYRKREP